MRSLESEQSLAVSAALDLEVSQLVSDSLEGFDIDVRLDIGFLFLRWRGLDGFGRHMI